MSYFCVCVSLFVFYIFAHARAGILHQTKTSNKEENARARGDSRRKRSRFAPKGTRIDARAPTPQVTVAEIDAFFDKLRIPPIASVAAAGVDVDGGAARYAPFLRGTVDLLESHKVHEEDMLNFKNRDAGNMPYMAQSLGADEANVNSTTAVELGTTRLYNGGGHNNSPFASRLQYCGAHGETYENLETLVGLFAPGLETADRDGDTFACPGAACNACRDGVSRSPENTHNVRHKLIVCADMLWLRMARGPNCNTCPKCGFNFYFF